MTTSNRRRHLRAVEGSLRAVPEPRCSVAAQAVMAGPQDLRVTAMTAEATGRGYGHICIRVGRLLVYLEDADALQAWRAAVSQAEGLAEEVFGPKLPPPAYRPRSRQ